MQIVLELKNGVSNYTDAQLEYSARWICDKLLKRYDICSSISKITINKNEETITFIPDLQVAIEQNKQKDEEMERMTEHIKQIYKSIQEIDLIYNR